MLSRRLAGKGAVLIEGPKWCGKTTTARQQSKSILNLGDTDVLRESLNMMFLVLLMSGRLFPHCGTRYDALLISAGFLLSSYLPAPRSCRTLMRLFTPAPEEYAG